MTSFRYDSSPDPIRPDLVQAYQGAWDHIAAAGTWLTGVQRVAVADETRRAQKCALCLARAKALSPFSVEGEHDHGGALSESMVDEIHRVTTDAGRLTEKWYRSLLDQGMTAETYVEALGVSVLVISIDAFHQAMGFPLEPLPAPCPGEPSRIRPDAAVDGDAWVPIQSARDVGALAGLPGPVPYVLRALSLVPDEVLAWIRVSDAQYLSAVEMREFGRIRELDRSQIELVAGRVSALNECFY